MLLPPPPDAVAVSFSRSIIFLLIFLAGHPFRVQPPVHWKAALGILEYINGTGEYGITFQRGTLSGISLEVVADADYASKATDRRSVSGRLVMCGGASVCWFSRTQKCVTSSTSEAEYIALGDAVKELLFLRQGWGFMLPSKIMRCFPVFEDN